MKKIMIAIICALGSQMTYSQDIGFAITGGVGAYELDDLKSYQSELVARLPVTARTFEQFPPYINVKIEVFDQRKSGFKYGLNYAYSNSGVHSNYRDNSGYLNVDQHVEAYQLGVTFSYRLLYSNKVEVLAYTEPRIAYIRDIVNLNITTFNYYENHSLSIRGLSPFLELGLNAFYNASTFSLGLEGAYMADAGGTLKASANMDIISSSISLKPTGELHSQMSGFRAGIKLIIWLRTLTDEE